MTNVENEKHHDNIFLQFCYTQYIKSSNALKYVVLFHLHQCQVSEGRKICRHKNSSANPQPATINNSPSSHTKMKGCLTVEPDMYMTGSNAVFLNKGCSHSLGVQISFHGCGKSPC